MLCKEGIFRDVLGEKLRRNKKNSKLLPTQLRTDELCCRAFPPAQSLNQVRPGARFSKVPKLFRQEKPFVKLRPTYSVKLVFSNVVKGITKQNNSKISWLETPSF